MSRLWADLRQHRHHRAFRIDESTSDSNDYDRLVELLIQAAEPGAPRTELDDRAFADALTYLWRAERKLGQRSADATTRARQADRFLRAAREELRNAAVVVRDHDGEPYHPGLLVDVLAFEEDATLTDERIVQTVRPAIRIGLRDIQQAQVIVGCPPKSSVPTPRSDHA